MSDNKPADLDVGEVLNNTYRLEQLVGQGGMGRVFAATDVKLERKVAVKALLTTNLDAETVRRFDRETQVMGQLDHPGVVTLFSFGRTRGVPWLAMRFLEGQDLWALLASAGGRMSPQALLPVVRQILAALVYLHGRGLLHRDLKPSNIHIGKTGKVTLCDFGLARGHQSSLTRTGVVWGTPEYMAPEQILGERELDGRADLYALGVVMFRMLAGQTIFPEKDDNELLRAHLSKPRPDVSRLVPTLSPLLGAALQKALAIHPEDRFQTAQEMAAAMELVLALPPAAAKTERSAVPAPAPRVEGTKPVGREQLSAAPASQTLVDEDDSDEMLQTRPAGFSALQDADSDGVTNRDGFKAVPEGAKVTQPVDAISAPTPVNEEVPWKDTSTVVASPKALQGKDDRTNPVTPTYSPSLPLPALIGGALALFLLGLLVAKLLL